MIGRTLANYEILEEIGEGGVGVVFRARDNRLHRDVAIKFLNPHMVQDQGAKQRFLQEARAASSLDHPNICTIYQAEETDDGQMYVVMGYYAGGTLAEHILMDPPELDQILDVALQVCAGLGKAHEKGIIHRDLKPSNVIVTFEGTAKILDFGMASIEGIQTLSEIGSSIGGPSYLAPEQVRGEDCDARTDIWAVGVLLYELICGMPPFQEDRLNATLDAILNDPTPPLRPRVDGVPAVLQEIVFKCLQKDPEQRFKNTTDLQSALLTALKEVPDSGASSRRSGRAAGAAATLVPAPGVPSAYTAARKRKKRAAKLVGQMTMVVPIVALLALGVWQALEMVGGPPDEPLRVAVLEPMVSIEDPSIDAELVEANVHGALLRGLTACDGVAPADPEQVENVVGGPMQVASALAIDEIVRAKVEDQGNQWNITLHRIDGEDGSLMRTRQFTAPKHEPLQVANAVHANLRQTYPEYDTRKGMPEMNVRPQDYARYLEIDHAFSSQTNDAEGIAAYKEDLDEITESSPGFVEAVHLQSIIARFEFALGKSAESLDRALEASRRARAMAPGDPRPLGDLFEIYVEANQLDRAEEVLGEYADLNPSHADLLTRRAELARHRQDPQRALELMGEAVARRPSRNNLFKLSDIELGQDRLDEARAHLSLILQREPGDPFARSRLAEVELLSGDPGRAETLYAEMIESGAGAAELFNLGLARLLLGKHDEARADFRRSLELRPREARTLIRLADAESYLGNDEEARRHYAAALELLEQGDGDPSWGDLLGRARCLVQLDRRAEALAATQDALSRSGDDAEAYYTASLVHAHAGAAESASENARRALELGQEPAWFGLPPFDGVRQDPELASYFSEHD